MKKTKILFLALSLLTVVTAVVLYIFLPPYLPEADNNTPARELISHYYSDEELEAIVRLIPEEVWYSSFKYEYETLDDLKHIFKFECLRDPSVYSDEYKPYVVLMSESGKKLFLFYDPQTLEIIDRTIIEDFMTYSEIQALIKDALVVNRVIMDFASFNRKTYGDVFELFEENRVALTDKLDIYDTGTDFSSSFMFYLYGVKEGVLALSLWAGAEIKIRSMHFYPNELIFSDKPFYKNSGPFELWPVLPIDKTE